jgi:tetratricopeptide (TPR) repeat protein
MCIRREIIISQLVICTAVGIASAGETNPMAETLYNEGKTHFEAGQFEEAMTAFTQAYNLTGEPKLLFNLAATAERLKDLERAAAYYRVYLEELPDAEDAKEVRARIDRLSSAQKAPNASEPPAAEPPAAEPPSSVTAKQAPEETAGPAAPTAPPPDPETYYKTEKEEKKRGPVWPAITVGAGGMMLVSGIITAILAKKKYDDLSDTCSPSCTDDKVSSAKGPAIATDVLLVTGGIAVTAGIIGLVLSKKKQKESRRQALQVFSGPVPNGAFVGAKGNF